MLQVICITWHLMEWKEPKSQLARGTQNFRTTINIIQRKHIYDSPIILFSHLAIFLFLIHSTHIQNIVTPSKNNTQNNLNLSLIIIKYKKGLTVKYIKSDISYPYNLPLWKREGDWDLLTFAKTSGILIGGRVKANSQKLVSTTPVMIPQSFSAPVLFMFLTRSIQKILSGPCIWQIWEIHFTGHVPPP